MFLLRIALLAFMTITVMEVPAQIRFYFQYEGIPFYKGEKSDFSVLSGIKLDPNKELVLGLGLAGRFNPRELDGDLSFNKKSFSLSFNYYFSRKFYVGMGGVFNQLKDKIEDNTLGKELLTGKFFLNYKFNLTYVVFRRLHFSFTSGIVDLTKLAVKTASEAARKLDLKPDVALSLRLYVFQIKV